MRLGIFVNKAAEKYFSYTSFKFLQTEELLCN